MSREDKSVDLPAFTRLLAERVYGLDPWQSATGQDIDVIRQQFNLLEPNEEFILALVRAVWDINMRIRRKGEVKRVLLPIRTEEEKELIFGGFRIRGPAAYLKVRFHDRQQDEAVPVCDMSTYYATLGVILVPARPPLIWTVNIVNEFTRQPVTYTSSPPS